jgi:pimeloyl-ACP methyl ester carboxylesterase
MRLCTCALSATVAALAMANPLPAFAQAVAGDSAGKTEWIQESTGRLKARIYASPAATATPVLVIALHGDAPFNKPGYQYTFAKEVASGGDVVSAAILRPGYIDAVDDTSSGERGRTTGDNYTRDRIDAIVTAIEHLRAEYHARAVVLVGHSGGAAISADILALYPQLAKAALLVSCPCDVPAWRAHMKAVHPSPVWDRPVPSLSPQDLVATVSRSVRVQMVVGAIDSVTPPSLTKRYADALKGRGVDVTTTLIPGKGHEIFLEPEVQSLLVSLLRGIGEPTR